MLFRKDKRQHESFFYKIEVSTNLQLAFVGDIWAGFPSPADDFLDIKIDLNKHLIKNPSTTFYGRVRGDSMIDAGLSEGDILIIDKSIEPHNGAIAVCFIDGEFTVKRIQKEENSLLLVAENEKYAPIRVTEENQFLIWGIVINVIKSF